jgi:23S rRNA-/tRNA-specific pseudouridylate synthase
LVFPFVIPDHRLKSTTSTTCTSKTPTTMPNSNTPLQVLQAQSDEVQEVQVLKSDNPCWGSPEHCDLKDLLSQLKRSKQEDQDPSKSMIVYESDHYVILNKPPDLRMDGPYPATVHKLLTYWYPPPSLKLKLSLSRRIGSIQKEEEKDTNDDDDEALLAAVSKLHQHNSLKDNALRPCHQLDYATSGVLCVARSHEAASFASAQWEDRKVKKSYLAILQGHVATTGSSPTTTTTTTATTSFDATNLPRLSLDHIESTLHSIEQAYRKSRSRRGSNTFAGFQPPHAIYHKWKHYLKASMANSSSNQKKKKRKRQLLTEDQWVQIFKPVHGVVPESCRDDLEWKQVCQTNVEWKRAFQQATNLHNDLLRSVLEEQQQHKENDDNDNIPSLPTVFGVEHDDNTLYICCPLAQASDEFAMKVPPHVSAQYPHLNHLAGATTADLDYKPSLTKCTILERASYQYDGDDDSHHADADTDTDASSVTKVQLWPLTGRRHQLRVHVALLNHAILGDGTYGGDHASRSMPNSSDADANANVTTTTRTRRGPPRMCLHSHYLSLHLLGDDDDENAREITTPDPFVVQNGILQVKAL